MTLRQIEVQASPGQELGAGVHGSGDFRAELRDECLRQEIFYSLKEVQAVISLGQNAYNRVRPHSSPGHRPLAPVTFPDLAFRLPMAASMQ
jgi:hypothetical protein